MNFLVLSNIILLAYLALDYCVQASFHMLLLSFLEYVLPTHKRAVDEEARTLACQVLKVSCIAEVACASVVARLLTAAAHEAELLEFVHGVPLELRRLLEV